MIVVQPADFLQWSDGKRQSLEMTLNRFATAAYCSGREAAPDHPAKTSQLIIEISSLRFTPMGNDAKIALLTSLSWFDPTAVLVTCTGVALLLTFIKSVIKGVNDSRKVNDKEKSMNMTNGMRNVGSSVDTMSAPAAKMMSSVLTVSYNVTVGTAVGIAANV